MKKPRIKMKNWELQVHDGKYTLSGYADKHPKLGTYAYVEQASDLQKATLKDDVLIYETTNFIFICPVKYMKIYNYRDDFPADFFEEQYELTKDSDYCLDMLISAVTGIALQTINLTSDFINSVRDLTWKGTQELNKQKRRRWNELAENVSKYEDGIYLEVYNVPQGDEVAYNIGGWVGVVEPRINDRPPTRSVIYIERGTIDFRYFANDKDNLETYSWSDNIKQVVIVNKKICPIKFNGTEVMPEEEKIFTIESHLKTLLRPGFVQENSAAFDIFGEIL